MNKYIQNAITDKRGKKKEVEIQGKAGGGYRKWLREYKN